MSEQIKETEIMIGNYLFASDQQIHQVSKFDDKTIWFEKTINRHGVSCWLTSKISECIPIPLTEDILLKCGARKVNHIHGYSFFTFSNSKINKAHIDIYEKKTCYYGSYVAKCKYLHQIQNLFKAITQTDLKVEV